MAVKDTHVKDFFNSISFIKKFPIDIPVFITCTYQNHGDVEMLVIPRYYHINAFRCKILAMSLPLIPNKYVSHSEINREISISIDVIKSWKAMENKSFLNFGNGFITEDYLEMVLN